MLSGKFALLPDRGVISVTGRDAGKLLQGLITNDMDMLGERSGALHSGLLSPQGKILAEFFVVKVPEGFLLDVTRAKLVDLIKRLGMYKLRADVTLQDVSDQFRVLALWLPDASPPGHKSGTVTYRDPRHPDLGFRILAEAETGIATAYDQARYDAHRISFGIPEGGKDYEFGDAYPHEAGFDVFGGVSFTKGCYVGQEVVARMQNKTVVRKRVVKISGAAALTSGADILLGEAAIGRIGTVDGPNGLAMLRLDRAVEAVDKSVMLLADGVAVTPDASAIAHYVRSAAARQAAPGAL